MEFKLSTKYILYIFRKNKVDKLIFSSKLTLLLYKLLLDNENIKYTVMEVFCYE